MNPSYLVFSQHGMVDTHQAMELLAKRNSDSNSRIIAPDLGFLNTLFNIEPLITNVEAIAIREIQNYPDVPIRIIGCSLGGVIWTEILTRHPEWWPNVESWVLLGSPIGGAHLAKIADPLNLVGCQTSIGCQIKGIKDGADKTYYVWNNKIGRAHV